MRAEESSLPMPLCACGCGDPTKLARQTDTKRGWVKGQPLRYLWGHSGHILRQRENAQKRS